MLLVDCYNVLHVAMPPSLAGLDEAGLCRILGTHPWAVQFGKIIVVADGKPKPGRADRSPVPNVSLRFSGRSKSADDVIIDILAHDSAPRSITVVSSDREIQQAARSRRATPMASEALVRELSKQSTRRAREKSERPDVSAPLPESMVEQWLEKFDADPHALGAPVTPAEILARAKAEAARAASEAAARPKKSTYRKYRKSKPESIVDKPLPQDLEIDFQISDAEVDTLVRDEKNTPPTPTIPAPAPPAKPMGKLRANEGGRERGLSSEDAARWMKEFGVDENAIPAADPTPARTAPPPASPARRAAPPVRSIEKIGEQLDKLTDGDIRAWLRVFGLDPDDESTASKKKR